MTKRWLFGFFAAATVLVAAVPVLRASDPCGIYGIVEKVVLEPNDTEPTTVQVWGVFGLADGKPGGAYTTPQRGYFYYTCAKGRDATCINEWTDLKSLAGKSQFVGFGGRWIGTGKLRAADEKPASPDLYPIQMGVLRDAPPSVKADVQAFLAKNKK